MTVEELLHFVFSNDMPKETELEMVSKNDNAEEGPLEIHDLLIDKKNNKIYIRQRDFEDNEYASGDF